MTKEEILEKIKVAAYEVRTNLTPGYLESVYQNALMVELRLQGLKAEKEVQIHVIYKNEEIGYFKADIVVENSVILELKAVSELHKIHELQLVNYLKLSGYNDGYLINFGAERYRIIHKTREFYKPTQST